VFEGNIEPLEVYRHFRHEAFASMKAFYAAFEREVEGSDYADLFAGKIAGFEPHMYIPESPFYTDEDLRFRFIRDNVLGPTRYHETMGSMFTNAGYEVRELAHILWMDNANLKSLDDGSHVWGIDHLYPYSDFPEFSGDSIVEFKGCSDKSPSS